MKIYSELCYKCKGRGFCGKHCKILSKFKTNTRELKNNLKQEFEGSSPPTIFVGSKLSYPNVNIGIMSLPKIQENSWIYDSPNYWSQKNINSKQIVDFRKNLINSRIQTKVTDIRKNSKILNLIQETGMAFLQSDFEIKLKNKPILKLNFDEHILPMGPSAKIENIKLISNPKIPKHIEKVYFDTDLKSLDALKYLYNKGLDEHKLTQILSIGVTGIKKNRKLVSTRNSITAIDDAIGKELLKEIRYFPAINEHTLYFGGHLGNYYLILLFPEVFSYELFEIVFPKTTWNPFTEIQIMKDYENYKGRKNYAEETSGGYYAARLPILQHLKKIKKQASCLVLRFVLPEYEIPLGVWVCRNSVKKALSSEKIEFKTKEELLLYAQNIINKKFNFNIQDIFNQSKLLNEIKSQKKLSTWF